jgi:hypothetical protein
MTLFELLGYTYTHIYIQLCSNVVVEVSLCTDFVFMDPEYAQDPDTELGADRGSYGAATRSTQQQPKFFLK